AIEQGLRPLAETVTDAEGEVTALIYPTERPEVAPVRPDVAAVPKVTSALVLDPLPPHRPIRIIRPSSVEKTPSPNRVLATRLEESADPEAARLSGTALHALLQHLGRVDPGQRPQVAMR